MKGAFWGNIWGNKPVRYNGYLASAEGQLALHRQRRLRRIYFKIEGIEPRGKNMPKADKARLQEELLEQLRRQKRYAFRGPVALQLTLATTDKTPTHSHNIAKNLLDLFGEPCPSLATRRRGLLYKDDYQVHALGVTCNHGEGKPIIRGIVSPFTCVREELDLVTYQFDGVEDDLSGPMEFEKPLDDLRDLRRDEPLWRQHFGDEGFEFLALHYRQLAQEKLLGRSVLRPRDLAAMYGSNADIAKMWEATFASSPLRVFLSAPPQHRGDRERWKKEIEEKLNQFQERYGGLLDPLLVPVALEVLIKPPPLSRRNGLHDLDNVLRNYLIPRVIGILKPPSSYAPGSTTAQLGITRFQAWRLPTAREGTKGFVGLALVCDLEGPGDVFYQLDHSLDRWEASLD